MKTRLKRFLKEETGTMVETLIKYVIIGLGSATIFFGILIALRQKGGELIDIINSLTF